MVVHTSTLLSLVDVRAVIENDDENIVRVVAPKQIDRFSPMKLVLSLWS